jgi:hypothetical protein
MDFWAPLGKILILIGGLLVLIGVLILCGIKFPSWGRLPGDILIRRDNLQFYFPITTCLLLSILLSLILYLLRLWKH